jgi:hypothetical protein
VLYAVDNPLANPIWTPAGNLIVVEQTPTGSRVRELTLAYGSGSPQVQGMPQEIFSSNPFSYATLDSLDIAPNGQSLLVSLRRERDAAPVVERWTRNGGGGWNTSRSQDAPKVFGKRPTFVYQQQGGTATPEPTATPDPNYLYYEQFKGIIFWAIYNESNENEQIPLYEALPNATADIANFLPNQDHRYVMARVILANIPAGNFGNGIEFMRRWGGSIANANYPLWQFNTADACEWNGSPIGSYASAISSGPEAILRWMRGYAECFRDGNPLENQISAFEDAYQDIMEIAITAAIEDHLNEAANPAPGAQFVKHTSSCFVWNRDNFNQITSCRGNLGRVDMRIFCNSAPNRPADPQNSRNCRVSSINPGNIALTNAEGSGWLQNDPESLLSNQQLGLDTVVGINYEINLGVYVPDQPIQRSDGTYTSGQGCENFCFFLIGNPIDNPDLRTPIEESLQASWDRHEERHTDPNFGYRANAQSFFVAVLRQERRNGQIVAQTWITYAFQQ